LILRRRLINRCRAGIQIDIIAAAKIDPTVLLDELRKALTVLTDEYRSEPPPIKGRPVLRLIEGGLSN
jgi:hypothetical protein